MGRAWMAIREDEIAAEMMGVNPVRTKLLAFALGAAFAGVAGVFQSSYQGLTTSDFFTFATSILVLIMVILGGIGNIWGVIVGAITLVFVDKTFLPYLGQRMAAREFETLGDINPSQFNFLIFGVAPRRDDAVPARGIHPEPPAGGGASPRPAGPVNRLGGDARRPGHRR